MNINLTLVMQAVSHVHESQPGWEVKAEVGMGSPASVIIEKADE